MTLPKATEVAPEKHENARRRRGRHRRCAAASAEQGHLAEEVARAKTIAVKTLLGLLDGAVGGDQMGRLVLWASLMRVVGAWSPQA